MKGCEDQELTLKFQITCYFFPEERCLRRSRRGGKTERGLKGGGFEELEKRR